MDHNKLEDKWMRKRKNMANNPNPNSNSNSRGNPNSNSNPNSNRNSRCYPNSNSNSRDKGILFLMTIKIYPMYKTTTLSDFQQKYPTPKFKNKVLILIFQVLRDFLINKGQYYCPPLKDLTDKFCSVIFPKFICEHFVEIIGR